MPGTVIAAAHCNNPGN